MADRGETIRDLLQGFNAMQQQLGLLPQQNNHSPLGVGLPPPVPPAAVPHPGQISMMANQMGMSGAQQTMSAAQQTRYIPPPSTPIFNPMAGGGMLSPTLGAISGGHMNPYMANALGGGAMSMPSPIYNTASQYGIYRPPAPSMMPMATGFAAPNMFNPFASGVPGPQFMMPSMHAHAMHQSLSAQAASMAVGGAAGVASMGGSMLGAAAFGGKGLLGMLGGGIAGGLVGMGASSLVNLMARPYLQEVGMANRIADQSRSFMVGGAFMSPSGAGFDMGASRQVARGLIGFGRDQGMQRELGFNTSDYSKIFSLAGQHGMLDMAQNPDQVLNQVKNVAKSVKAFMQIAQEPDVREAMRMMGQFRTMGMNLQESNAAAFNARQFSRMAGVSMQAGMNMFGNPGAAVAQGIGLSGGLGFNVGMASGGMARMAVAGGAFNEQQLAMAGGVQGLAQINTTSGLSAVNLNAVLPGLLQNQGGKLSINQDLLRKYQSGALSIRDLTQMGAQNMRDWGQSGIENVVTQMQEQKDSLGRMLGPQGAQMLALRQAMDIRKETGGTLGGAFMKLGYAPEQARALELQYTSKGFWDTQSRQMQVEAQDMYDRERSRRARYESPSTVQGLRRGIGRAMNVIGDVAASPFAAAGDYLEHTMEDRAAWKRGATVARYRDDELMSSAAEEDRIARFVSSGGYQRAASRMGVTGRALQMGSGGTTLNRFGAWLGTNSLSMEGRFDDIYSDTFNANVFNPAEALAVNAGGMSAKGRRARVMSAAAAGDVVKRADRMTASASRALNQDLQRKGAVGRSGFDLDSVTDSAAGVLLKAVDKYHDGGVFSTTKASGMTEHDLKEAAIAGLVSGGNMSRQEAERFYAENKDSINTAMLRKALPSASDHDREVFNKSLDASDRARAATSINRSSLDSARKGRDALFREMGFGDIGGGARGKFDIGVRMHVSGDLENIFKRFGTDQDALTYAAITEASIKDPTNKKVQAAKQQLRAKLGKRADEVAERAEAIRGSLTQSQRSDLTTATGNLIAGGKDVGAVFGQVQEASDVLKAGAAMTAFAGRNKSVDVLRQFSEAGSMDEKAVGDLLSKIGTDATAQEQLKSSGQGWLVDLAKKAKSDKTGAVRQAMAGMVTRGDASKKTMVGGMEISPEMAGRMEMFDKMREEALAAGDTSAAGAATLGSAAEKLDMVADKMLNAATKAEASNATQTILGIANPWAVRTQ